MPIKIHIFLLSMLLILISINPSFSSTVTLLDENFDDVTGLTSSSSVRDVSTDILVNDPTQLPSGTTSTSSVNVRRGDNTINTSTLTGGFDSFFTATSSNEFLVLGDATGQIGSGPANGTFAISFPFSVPLDATSVTIQFDYAFDGVDNVTVSSGVDVFLASVSDGTSLQLVSSSSPDGRTSTSTGNIAQGTFNTIYLPSGLPSSADLFLLFSLSESTATGPNGGPFGTNTAAGIDNVLVTAEVPNQDPVPEPSTFLLIGVGLAGVGLLRRKFKKWK